MKDDLWLAAFALGTFHAVLVTLTLAASLYLSTDPGELLDGLNTALGLAIFAVLWATSVYCTRRAMRSAGLDPATGAKASAVLGQGVAWGAWNGVLFAWCLLAGGFLVLIALAVPEGVERTMGVVSFGVIAFGFGTIFAAIVGAAIGFMLAALDLTLLAAAQGLAGGGLDRNRA